MELRGAHLRSINAGGASPAQGFYWRILFWRLAYGVPMPASRHTPPKSALPRSAMPVPAATGAAPRFEERVRAACRVRGYSIRTEDAYWMWTRQFILHHGKRHPETMGAEDIRAFLTALVLEREVAPGTQMQALNALVFVFKNVLEREPGDLAGIVRSKRARKVPVVLGVAESRALLAGLDGTALLMAQLLYGAGLRMMECVRLRVKGSQGAGHLSKLWQVLNAEAGGLVMGR